MFIRMVELRARLIQSVRIDVESGGAQRARAPAVPEKVRVLSADYVLSKPGTTESMVLWPCTESGLYRVVFDVFDGFLIVLRISDIAVEIVQHPELTASPETLICFMRCDGFEGLHNVRQDIVLESRNQKMNMIGHYDPA